jgi:hypothetical protein
VFLARKNCVKSTLVLAIYTILLALNAGSSRAQTTITVPTNYPTIQSAINAANNNNTISNIPQGKTTTQNYSLHHARSGSDRKTASTSPLWFQPRHSQAFAILSDSEQFS